MWEKKPVLLLLMATAAILVNSIPAVIAAAPGLGRQRPAEIFVQLAPPVSALSSASSPAGTSPGRSRPSSSPRCSSSSAPSSSSCARC